MSVTAVSNDGKPHIVAVYSVRPLTSGRWSMYSLMRKDCSAEWATGDVSQTVTWSTSIDAVRKSRANIILQPRLINVFASYPPSTTSKPTVVHRGQRSHHARIGILQYCRCKSSHSPVLRTCSQHHHSSTAPPSKPAKTRSSAPSS
jgi:hypothetical protein